MLVFLPSPWHWPSDPSGCGEWADHLQLCGVWVQGPCLARTSLLSARLAVSGWWVHVCSCNSPVLSMLSHTDHCSLWEYQPKPCVWSLDRVRIKDASALGRLKGKLPLIVLFVLLLLDGNNLGNYFYLVVPTLSFIETCGHRCRCYCN